MSLALDISNLSKTYPRRWLTPATEALSELSLQVQEGEVFGFVGPNGAGKSTTIKILTGFLLPTAGSAFVFGVDVRKHLSRKGLGFVPEISNLPEYLTPLEVLEMALSLHEMKLSSPRQHCMNWLDRFGLAHVANKVLRGFSKGMVQRTALAHALAIQPRLLILDEPLSGLDPVGRKEVVDILAEYKSGGGTVFLTSHVLHDVERLADRFGLIHKGQLRTVQTPLELVHSDDRVLVRSMGDVALAGMVAEGPGRWSVEISRPTLWQQLEQLEKAGHRLIEVKPTLTLETHFLRQIGKE